jgi:hypothetical protein
LFYRVNIESMAARFLLLHLYCCKIYVDGNSQLL